MYVGMQADMLIQRTAISFIPQRRPARLTGAMSGLKYGEPSGIFASSKMPSEDALEELLAENAGIWSLDKMRQR